jgi:hypothetical protein
VEAVATLWAGNTNTHKPNHNFSFLTLACKYGSFDSARWVTEAGVSVDDVDAKGITPLCRMAKNGCLEGLSFLVQEANADVNRVPRGSA